MNGYSLPRARLVPSQAVPGQGRRRESLDCFERALGLRPTWRWTVVQAAIARLGARTYLEIGVSTGTNFCRIVAPRKIGVDPAGPSAAVRRQQRRLGATFHSMTSDEFFAGPAAVLEREGLDVAFVDGLHTFRQSMVDVRHCLGYLNPGGAILLHDCNPTDQAMATPAASVEEARAKCVPGWTGEWTGDVWKTIVALRSSRPDLTAFVLDCDYGIGVVLKRPAQTRLPFSPQEILRWTYQDLEARRAELLDLRPPDGLFRWIGH